MKRLTLFCGHYGSGKTNIAVNFAFYLKSKGFNTVIADLDIVNPYFRTKDSEKELEDAGIDVISLPFANTNVDLPSIPSGANSLFDNITRYGVIDVGGDDAGAYALGRFSSRIKEENNFENYYVVNFYRPLTKTPLEAKTVMDEITMACNIPFTGIVNNSNIGEETTVEDVEKTSELAKELSRLTGLPIAFTSIDKKVCDDESKYFIMKLQEKYW